LSSHALLRLLTAASALAVMTWLALGLRATLLEAEGREALEQSEQGAGQPDGALDDLRAARRWNSGNAPRLIEARLLAADGRPAQAVALAEEVAGDEPENLEAWAVLYIGALAIDREPLARRSLQIISELDPQLGERLRSRPAPGP
jgi:hypothetical protein